jgi:exodeoxyribonuclease V
MSDTIELVGQQLEAVEAVKTWHSNDGRAQTFRLFGYAGTGKTTVARELVSALGLDGKARYAAFTGKAAHVLASKGCHGAQTIHSLIYHPVEKARERLNELYLQRNDATDPAEQLRLDQAIEAEQREIDSPGWIVNPTSELLDADLLVLDEVSMVDSTMALDLLDFGVPTLVLGDPAQLPPIDGTGYFTDAVPDVLLTEIHRSALDSPVTRLATAVREADESDSQLGVPGMDDNSGRWHRRLSPSEALRFEQVIVWRNATRWRLINAMRRAAGHEGFPQAGERIIGLVNDREAGILNGQQLTVRETLGVTGRDDSRVLDIAATTEYGVEVVLRAWAVGFSGTDGETKARRQSSGPFRRPGVVAATFAHAITVHKAQGSQWGKVLVVDETAGLRSITGRNAQENGAGPDEARAEATTMAKRWMYTAITRASDQVILTANIR